MRKFAQVLAGRLHWKFEQEAEPQFAPEIVIIEITTMAPEPQEGWEWDGRKFIAPPPPPLEEAKKHAFELIAAFAKGMRVKIAGTSDEIEIAGWNNKLRIANAIQTGTATDAEVAAFAAEIATRSLGETMDTFVAKVIRNGMSYAQAVGLIDGLKRKAQGTVEACATVAEVDAVLAAVNKDAETAFAELMKAAS